MRHPQKFDKADLIPPRAEEITRLLDLYQEQYPHLLNEWIDIERRAEEDRPDDRKTFSLIHRDLREFISENNENASVDFITTIWLAMRNALRDRAT